MVMQNGVPKSAMEAVFPEALKSLKEADPELHSIVEDEKRRQWCVGRSPAGLPRICGRQKAGGAPGQPTHAAAGGRLTGRGPGRPAAACSPAAAGRRTLRSLLHPTRAAPLRSAGAALSSSPRKTSPPAPCWRRWGPA